MGDEHVYAMMLTWRSDLQNCFLIPPRGSRGLDVSHQIWWQASLTNELSLWPQLRAILMNVGFKTLSKETCCYSEDLYDLVK